MMHKNEAEIIEASKTRLERVFAGAVPAPQVKVSGLVMDGYRFLNDSKPFKIGHIFHANKQERIPFALRAGETVEESIGKESARFLVGENNELSTMRNVMRLGFNLKHIGILKPIFVAQNSQLGPHNPQVDSQNHQLPKVVAGFSSYDQSFNDWLANQKAERGTFLHETEKQMLRTAYAAIDEMWRSGYTCDSLADPASYVMIGSRIKIPSHLCRPKDAENDTDFMLLRNALADLLHYRIEPLWIVPGLQDFVLLLRNQNAGSIEDIFGHPLLLKPGRRQLMYRTFNSRQISSGKLIVINKTIQFSPNWKTSSPHNDQVVDSICTGRIFSKDAEGALKFADIVSKHYVQHLKALKMDWYNHMKDDTVDKALAESVTGLLSKRYVLKFDSEFIAA